MEVREIKDIISDIKELVNTKGYIYTLCLIIMDDFHFNVEKMHEVDNRARLNKNEVSLLIGFLIQNRINLDTPESPFDLAEQKKKTYKLMDELHRSTLTPMFEKFKPLINNLNSSEQPDKRDFFGGENVFIEPIFYAGDGIYDFQYLEFLNRKYKYDEPWLNLNSNFYFDEINKITSQIKNSHQEKIRKVNFLGLKENKSQIIKDLKKDKSIPKNERGKNIDEFFTIIEFFQFFKLFETDSHIKEGLNTEEIGEKGWSSFYTGIIDLFTIRKSDFNNSLNIDSFLDNFSINLDKKERNKQFQNIGDFNLFTAKPIIQLDSERFFVPISFSVFEAVYESPYYWMQADNQYKNKLAENRGRVGEEITYELLKKVFGEKRIYKSVKIVSKKGHDDTDIDVLCILGSKALCVQVKSKKLTQLSRKGNFNQLQTDFKNAVQDAYEQGLICRERIIEKKATFLNESGEKIDITEDIEEVYILGITTENYPTLTHQTFAFLEKEESAPHPLFLTIFDLELVLFYLNNPYDFLYYVRQRIELMEYFHSNEEINYLGYHLTNKLWKDPKFDYYQLDTSLGQLVDRNYYPLKLGIKTSSVNDKIGNRWKNEDFEILCNQIDEINSPKKTDIIFHLLDWSEESRENLIKQIKTTKQKTNTDGKWHNFSIMAGLVRSSFGLTFISWNDNDIYELNDRLLQLSSKRKYKSKADFWIGIGCLKNSGRFVDSIVFSDAKWEFDEEMEKEIETLLGGKNQGTPMKLGRKIGRNEFCPCGSGLKYKKCCGRKF